MSNNAKTNTSFITTENGRPTDLKNVGLSEAPSYLPTPPVLLFLRGRVVVVPRVAGCGRQKARLANINTALD